MWLVEKEEAKKGTTECAQKKKKRTTDWAERALGSYQDQNNN